MSFGRFTSLAAERPMRFAYIRANPSGARAWCVCNADCLLYIRKHPRRHHPCPGACFSALVRGKINSRRRVHHICIDGRACLCVCVCSADIDPAPGAVYCRNWQRLLIENAFECVSLARGELGVEHHKQHHTRRQCAAELPICSEFAPCLTHIRTHGQHTVSSPFYERLLQYC